MPSNESRHGADICCFAHRDMQATKSKTSLTASTLNSAVHNTKLTNLHHSSIDLQNLLFVQMGFCLTLGRKPWHKQCLVCTSCLYAACQLCSDFCVMHVPLFLKCTRQHVTYITGASSLSVLIQSANQDVHCTPAVRFQYALYNCR